ncbi:MAG: glycosyltransferase family 4 protein [Gemmatimonadales bacterium]
MRVFVVSSSSNDPATRDKLRAVAGLGAEIVVATPNGEAGTDRPLRVVPVPVKGAPEEPDELRWNERTLTKLLSELRPDLIHVEESSTSSLVDSVSTIADKLELPFVLMSWEQPADSPPGLLVRRRAEKAVGRAAGLIGGNRRAEVLLLERASEGVPSTVIPQHGIAIPPTARVPATGRLRIGFVGRLVPERGLDVLIRALAQTYGEWELAVLGTGPEQERGEALAARHGLAARIRWLGGVRREPLEALLDELDTLVVPSRETPSFIEIHSVVVLDAMARSVVPVVSKAGALPDLVGAAGRVATEPSELSALLQPWVDAPERCRALGPAARQRVLEHFVTAQIAARTLEFWRAVGANRAAATT